MRTIRVYTHTIQGKGERFIAEFCPLGYRFADSCFTVNVIPFREIGGVKQLFGLCPRTPHPLVTQGVALG